MRAWTQDTYGNASVLTLAEVAPPQPKADEVLIAPVAVGVNNGDTRVMRGEPLLVRLFFGLNRPAVATRGMDVAGTIETAGNGFAVGDRVLAETAGGGFAELVSVAHSRVVRVPENVALHTAAALPVAASTAFAALEAAGVTDEAASGRRVLVLGASGGVASYAIALALSRGAHVTAVCRESAVETVRSWGAQDVRARDSHPRARDSRDALACAANDPLAPGERFDAIIDIAGDRTLTELRSRLTKGGRAALVSGEGSRFFGPVGRILRSVFLSRRSARLVPVAQKSNQAVLTELITLVADGTLVPRITRTVDFAEVPAALAAVARGEVMGKSVVSVRAEPAQKDTK